MAYDPCGTKRLDGEDILRRLAEFFKVSPLTMDAALRTAIEAMEKKYE